MKYERYLLVVIAIPVIFFSSWTGVFYYQLGTPVEEHIFKRHKRLQDKLIVLERFSNEQKIVIVSGSNSLYGLSAREIENALGITTINMAVNAHAGMRYYLDKIKPYLKDHDIVILPIEYLLLNDEFHEIEFPMDTNLLVLREDPEFFSRLPVTDKLKLIFRIHYTSLMAGILFPLPVEKQFYHYFSDDRNWRGDLVKTVHPRPKQFKKPAYPVFTYPDRNIHRKRISEFVTWAGERNINVIGTYPTYVYSDNFVNNPGNKAFLQRVVEFWDGLGITVFGTPQEMMYPKEMYYSAYHLSSQGRLLHTGNILQHIKDYLAKEQY